MKARFHWLMMIGAFIAVVAMTSASASASQITATLDSQSIALGDSAQLTVTVTGSDAAEPDVPAVKGLEIAPAGQSSSFESINGQISSSVSFLYQVTADRAGVFTIPAIQLPDGSSSQSLTLRVSKTAPGAAAPPLSTLPAPNMQSGNESDTADANGEPAFLRVIVPKQQLYIGEVVPVQVKAYFRAGMAASLNGLPTLNSDAFTLNKLDDKPDQSQETVGGLPYTVVTWSSALSAVKTGDYDLHLELPVVVTVREKGGRVDPFKQFFGDSGVDDSAFDDFFGGMTEKPLTLQADLSNVKVLSLPTMDRPTSFDGAVGNFEVSAEASPTKLTEGDPITLRLHVSGQGNFDRVDFHGLATLAAWKSYSTRAQFEPADSAGYAGTKTFEQAVIPLKSGQQEIPVLSFSYFDPDTHRYVTRKTTPIPIDIAPGISASSAVAPPAGPATSSTRLPSANTSMTDLAPNKVETGSFSSTLRPLIFAPWFIVMQGVPVMVLIAGLLLHRRQKRLSQDPERARNRSAKAAIREQLAAMGQALAANSAPAFFIAARHVVQEQLAERWKISATQVTAVEINRRLNGDGDDLRNLFAVADDVVYSGRRMPATELQHWKDTVMHQLKNLEER